MDLDTLYLQELIGSLSNIDIPGTTEPKKNKKSVVKKSFSLVPDDSKIPGIKKTVVKKPTQPSQDKKTVVKKPKPAEVKQPKPLVATGAMPVNQKVAGVLAVGAASLFFYKLYKNMKAKAVAAKTPEEKVKYEKKAQRAKIQAKKAKARGR